MKEDNKLTKLEKGIINELKYLNNLRESSTTDQNISISELKVKLYSIMANLRVNDIREKR